MPFQVLYQSNYDYYNSYNRLLDSPVAWVYESPGGKDGQGRGSLIVSFKDFKSTALIHPIDKIQVAYFSEEEKTRLEPLLRQHLVTRYGNWAKLKPLQVNLSMAWPPPKNFKFSACSTSFRAHISKYEPLRRLQRACWFLWTATIASGALWIITKLLLVFNLA